MPTSWIRTKSDEAAADAGCYFDLAAADRVRFFFERFIRHSKGQFAGKKFELLDWEWDRIVAPIFGWKMPDGTRRFRRAGIALPKKQGKSTLLSGLSIYMLMGDNEPGAEVYSAAADRDQAAIIYNEAANMVEASASLEALLRVRRATKIIRYPKGQGIYKALSSDVATKEGLNIHCLLFDELHAQPNWNLWNTLRYGGAARRQPLLIWISTAGVYDPNSLCLTQWNIARDIQDSKIVDISYHACIYETPKDADWKSPGVWKAANPSFGVTTPVRDFEEAVVEAEASPVNENNFKRYRLNMWTQQVTRWISQKRWADGRRDAKLSDFYRKPCRIGLDLASTTDIVAADIQFKVDDTYMNFPMFWVPQPTLRARELNNRTSLEHWARQGFIKLTTASEAVDYDVILEDLLRVAEKVRVTEFAIDPWNATQLATNLQKNNFKVEFVRQGFASLGPASKEFEKLIIAGKWFYQANPVLDWMIGNVAVEQDAAGNIKPSKRRSAEKIDGVIAMINPLALAIKAVAKKSKYDKQKLTILEARDE